MAASFAPLALAKRKSKSAIIGFLMSRMRLKKCEFGGLIPLRLYVLCRCSYLLLFRWFISRGVALKAEPDGRMFPTTDDSRTIANCLMNEVEELGIDVHMRSPVTALHLVDAEGGHAEMGKCNTFNIQVRQNMVRLKS